MNPLRSVLALLGLVMLSGCGTANIDLTVNRVDWDPASKMAEVEIANIGSTDAGAFLVYVNADEFPESQNHRPQVSHHVPALGSSDTIVLQSDFAPLAHPDNNNLGNVYQITAIADPKSTVAESDEENNFFRTPAGALSVELYDNLDQLVPDNPAPLADGTSRLPILFVHGHDLFQSMDQDFNYRKNWQDPLDYTIPPVKLPAFKIAIDRPDNAAHNIEPYYIRFQDQNRSITQDAAEIGEAIKRILIRHNDPDAQQVKVVIVAYSKGTISSRWYLRHMLPMNRPVSEFIAISPPNHGVVASNSNANASLALRQLNNGFDENCTSFQEAASLDFIERLNGHPIEDTMSDSQQLPQYRHEAPESRSGAAGAGDGILYVTLYAPDNKDRVGGSTPSNDCQGRVLAKNLAPDAENREVPQITALSLLLQTPLIVHANTVHTPDVICLALYTAIHHEIPPPGFSCTTQTVDGRDVPIVP